MNFTKISVLVPTRDRIGRLTTLIYSFDDTVVDKETAELVFRVDDDDHQSQDYLMSRGEKMIVGPRLKGYDSMPAFFNEMALAAAGDVLLCGNDDMVFRTIGWPDMVLKVANQFPDGLFDIGVSTHNETHYPFSIVSKRAADHLGYLWDPEIFWGDIFLRDTMQWFNRCVMVPQVQIDHIWAGFNPDHVFLEGTRDIVGRNPTYWQNVHAPAVTRAALKLQELLV